MLPCDPSPGLASRRSLERGQSPKPDSKCGASTRRWRRKTVNRTRAMAPYATSAYRGLCPGTCHSIPRSPHISRAMPSGARWFAPKTPCADSNPQRAPTSACRHPNLATSEMPSACEGARGTASPPGEGSQGSSAPLIRETTSKAVALHTASRPRQPPRVSARRPALSGTNNFRGRRSKAPDPDRAAAGKRAYRRPKPAADTPKPAPTSHHPRTRDQPPQAAPAPSG